MWKDRPSKETITEWLTQGLQRSFSLEEERAFRIAPLDTIRPRGLCLGSSRFRYAPSFTQESVLTCHWYPGSVQAELVIGPNTWYDRELADDERNILRWRQYVPLALIPDRIAGWGRLQRALSTGPSCDGGCLDGYSCDHSAWDGKVLTFVSWSNPHAQENRAQLALIRAYFDLIPLVAPLARLVWLLKRVVPWLPMPLGPQRDPTTRPSLG